MREYSEKEIAIFEGVRRLMAEDVNLAQVTASDIAAAAGIGKGTLYNYFKTKDEIIAETVFYVVELQLGAVMAAVEQEEDFVSRLRTAFLLAETLRERKDSQIHLALMGIDFSLPLAREHSDRMMELYQRIRQVLLELIRQGVGEGVIHPASTEYALEVLRGIITGYCIPTIFPDHAADPQQRALWAVTTVMKALN